MATSKVSAKGWVVIPKAIRKRYGIKPGDKVSFVDYGGTIYVFPVPKDPIKASLGMLKKDGHSLMEEFLEEHRREQEREEAKIAYWSRRS